MDREEIYKISSFEANSSIFHPDPKEGTTSGSSKQRMGQVMLRWMPLLSLRWVQFYIPKSTSRSQAIIPGPSQVNPFPRAAHPNFAHFDPWRNVGSLMLSFFSYIPRFHPSGPSRQTMLESMLNYRHWSQRKIANLKNGTFSQSIHTKLLSTISKKQANKQTNRERLWDIPQLP